MIDNKYLNFRYFFLKLKYYMPKTKTDKTEKTEKDKKIKTTKKEITKKEEKSTKTKIVKGG